MLLIDTRNWKHTGVLNLLFSLYVKSSLVNFLPSYWLQNRLPWVFISKLRSGKARHPIDIALRLKPKLSSIVVLTARWKYFGSSLIQLHKSTCHTWCRFRAGNDCGWFLRARFDLSPEILSATVATNYFVAPPSQLSYGAATWASLFPLWVKAVQWVVACYMAQQPGLRMFAKGTTTLRCTIWMKPYLKTKLLRNK